MNDHEITRMSHQIVTDVRAHLGYQGTDEERIGAAGTVKAWLYKLLELEADTQGQPAIDERVKEIIALVKQNTGPAFGYTYELCEAIRYLLGVLSVQPAQDFRPCIKCRHEGLFSNSGTIMCQKPVRTEAAKDKSTAETHAEDFEGCGCRCEFAAQPAASTPTERQMPDTPSGRAWRDWFERVGEHATVDVVNATATLVIRERDHAAANTGEQDEKLHAVLRNHFQSEAERIKAPEGLVDKVMSKLAEQCQCTDHDPEVCLNGEVDEGSRYCHCKCHQPTTPPDFTEQARQLVEQYAKIKWARGAFPDLDNLIERIASFAAEAATQGQVAGIERALKYLDRVRNEARNEILAESTTWNTLDHRTRQQIANEAATAALEQAARAVMALPDHSATCGVWLQQVCSCSFRTEVLYAIAAMGDDKEQQR